ncbi:MAG: SPOR domain-containing protein [Treponema sp.]
MKKVVILCAVWSVFAPLAARQTIPLSVRRVAEEAFAQKSYTATVSFFDNAITQAASTVEKCILSQLLAEYAERYGNYPAAAIRYRSAAALAAAFDTAQEEVLLLNAARAFLAGGSILDARTILEELSAFHSNSGRLSDHAVTAAVYKLWLLIAEGHIETALQQAQQYTRDVQFKPYHAALLFTLWWVDNDYAAGQRLHSEFPDSPESKAVSGELLIQPSVFWYLMPRSRKAVAVFSSASYVQDPQTNSGTVQSRSDVKKVRSYQIGFYKTHKYAAGLVEKLQQAGFEAYIREETRPSGTVYFAVLVDEKPHTSVNTIGEKLKNAGYEPFLLPE